MDQNKLYYKMQQAFQGTEKIVPSEKDPIQFDPAADLNIVLWGDPQVSSISPARVARMHAACMDLSHAEGTADALVLLGDITEYGMESEFRTATDLLEQCQDSFNHLLCVSGNHDVRLRNHKKQLAVFQNFVRNAPNGKTGSDNGYFYAIEIKGYRFILLGTERATFEGTYLSDHQLANLDKLISEANGKPVFVFNHQTLKGANGLPFTWGGPGKWRGSVGWESDKLKAVFDKHENVFFITGHLHSGLNPNTYEDYNHYKTLSVPTIGVVNHSSFDPSPVGYILSVYKDKIVARARHFAHGLYADEKDPFACFEIPLK